MKKFTKYIAVGTMCCALLCTVVSVKASSGSYSYSTSSKISYGEITNNSANAKTLSVSTRPVAGNGGVLVKITNHAGAVKASKVFPYYTSTGALTDNMPSKSKRSIHVEPNIAGQHVEGVVSYSY